MNSFLSHVHSHLRSARITRRGATHRPEDVPRGVHKEYPRMTRIALPDAANIPTTLYDALQKRSSKYSDGTDMPLTLEDIGTLLSLSLGKRKGVYNRNYPSGGALYPVETYLVSTSIEGQPPAVFHYHPTDHALERLWDLPDGFSIKSIAKNLESFPLSTLVIFTGVWERSSAKYGDLSYQHTLIEAGHMSENVLLVAGALGLEARPYAGFDDAAISQLLDLDEKEEQAVHSITLCKKCEKNNVSGKLKDR